MTLIEQIKMQIAKQIMLDRGWKEDESPIEWDLNREDSQFTLVLEETDEIVDKFLAHLATIEDGQVNLNDEVEEDEDDDDDYSPFDEYGHLKRDKTNTISSALFIFMDAGTGNPRYVSDVREWLKRVDTAGIPDDTEVEGSLHLSYDVDLSNAEKIECLECQSKEDLLLTVHKCTASEQRCLVHVSENIFAKRHISTATVITSTSQVP